MKMKDLDKLSIEDIIRLPFFLSLEKRIADAKLGETTDLWKITFRCNKTTASGFALLDEFFENENVVRYKIIDFK